MQPDFLFLHGGLQGGWVWSATIAAMTLQEPAARCFLLDVPGCGAKRGRDTADMGFDDIVAELVDDVAAAGLSRAILVGHSQGGTLLPRMVERAPDLFGRLFYVSCVAPEPGQTTLVGTAGSAMAKEPVERRTLSRERLQDMFCNDMGPAQAAEFMAAIGQDSWPTSSYAETDWRYDHLADIPSAYIICLRDQTVPVERQALFARRLHADQMLRIDAGHQVMVTRPHALAEMLLG